MGKGTKKLKELLRPSPAKRIAFYLVGEVILVPLTVFMAYWLRFEGPIPEGFLPGAWALSGFALAIIITVNSLTGFYRMKWGGFGSRDTIYGASVIAFISVITVIGAYFGLVPRSIPFIWWLVAFPVFLLFRGGKTLARCIASRVSRFRYPACVLIIPTDNREDLVNFLYGTPWLPYRIAGIIDPNPHNLGSTVHGVRVIGTPETITDAVKQTKARCVIVIETSRSRFSIGDLWEDLKELDVEVRVISSDGSSGIRKIGVRDLIRREPVKVDLQSIGSFIRDKRVMVTGAGGSIGSELARRIVEFGPEEIVLFERDETALFRINDEMSERSPNALPFLGDITSEGDLEEVFSRHSPQIVFHAAAYKHVPMMEIYPHKAIVNNIWGTYLVASNALSHGAEVFVNISTDKAVEPESVMGATKRVAEMLVRALSGNGTRMSSVRFGNVLGSRGSVLELFEKRIAERKPIFVTHRDMERYFMLVEEAVLLVLEAAAHPQEGLYVLNMGERINIYEMAEKLIRMSGLVPGKDIKIITTGKRPGEKITEELFWKHERAIPIMEGRFFKVDDDLEFSPDDFLSRVNALVMEARKNRADGLCSSILDIAWGGVKKEEKWLHAS